jgi:hypothetical protein
MGGGGRPVRGGNELKKTGARSARARTRGQTPLVYIYFSELLYSMCCDNPTVSGSLFCGHFYPLTLAPGWGGGGGGEGGLMSRCRWCLCCGQRAARWQQRTHQLQPSRPQTSAENITKTEEFFINY